ncbi:hypothetical protein B0H13DRAFT_2393740 [Mycena leptocephala]|nr:hypothetical protein B0H13DRAFT_2393740 [Mycena leptocephala]
MSPPVQFLEPGSIEDIHHQYEVQEIKDAWRRRDRRKIKTYDQFVTARGFMEGRLAASRAIAGWRSTVTRRFQFGRWLEHHATSIPLPPDVFGGAPHLPGMWHSYRNTDGTWSRYGGVMDATRWITRTNPPKPKHGPTRPPCPWGSGGWPAPHDPNWDGILVAKTPGKARRWRQRKLQLREQAKEERQEREREEREGMAQLPSSQLRPPGVARAGRDTWGACEPSPPMSEAELFAVGWGRGTAVWGSPP